MLIREVADILDDAMYKRLKLEIKTKERGVIIGIPHNVDEFDADPDRLGYFIMIEPHLGDTVFLDEVIAIETQRNFPNDIKLISGK